MKEIHRRSADEAVNQMLLTAYHRQISLVWDREECSHSVALVNYPYAVVTVMMDPVD